jgi:hypothetical protein
MSSPAQALASQINGAKSRGPVTPEGRERSSQNATTHGLSGTQTVLPGESQADFDRLLAGFVSRFQPQDEIETELVNEMASARWRMRRASRLETLVLNEEIAKLQNDPEFPLDDDAATAQAFMNLTARGGAITQLHRHEARLRRCYERAMKELELLREAAAAAGEAEDELTGVRPASGSRSKSPSYEKDAMRLIDAFMHVPRPRAAMSPASTEEARLQSAA